MSTHKVALTPGDGIDPEISAAVNRWMLERMMARDSRFILSTENVDAYCEELWELAIEHQPYSSCIEMPEACGVWNTP